VCTSARASGDFGERGFGVFFLGNRFLEQLNRLVEVHQLRQRIFGAFC
jgi:hypothetical protein